MLANSSRSQAIWAWEEMIRTCSFLEHLVHILVSLVKNQLNLFFLWETIILGGYYQVIGYE